MYFIGKKIGMTRFFLPDGKCVCVTAVFLLPNVLCDKGMINNTIVYKVCFGFKHKVKLAKSLKGEFKFLSFFGQGIYQLSVFKDLSTAKVGENFDVSFFYKEGEYVNISGISKGKGFSGVVKRHNFKMQPVSHGNSLSHRAPGSIGQCQSPGKVFKGKKMAGRLGNEVVFLKNIEIVLLSLKYNFLLLKGSIPGCTNSLVKIMKK